MHQKYFLQQTTGKLITAFFSLVLFKVSDFEFNLEQEKLLDWLRIFFSNNSFLTLSFVSSLVFTGFDFLGVGTLWSIVQLFMIKKASFQ